MIRLHLDDIRASMAADLKQNGLSHFSYLKGWLERHRAIIVQPDPVRIPDNFQTGCFTTRAGRWEDDEPFPPYGGYRKQFEDAVKNGPPKPEE